MRPDRFFVLVTGSRTWTDKNVIETELTKLRRKYPILSVVHGACRTGADAIADEVAGRLGIKVERYPADWTRHGRRAGFVRNAQMVKLGAHLCLAFITNKSPGATHCATLAEKAGIPVTRYTETVPVVAAGTDDLNDMLF